MSRSIVVIVCILGSSESWEHYQRPHPWHSRAGGGAVHSIKSGHSTKRGSYLTTPVQATSDEYAPIAPLSNSRLPIIPAGRLFAGPLRIWRAPLGGTVPKFP